MNIKVVELIKSAKSTKGKHMIQHIHRGYLTSPNQGKIS